MTYSLAFAALPAGHSQQRARCATTGRFVRWALAPSLRVDGVAVTASPVAVETPVVPVAAVVLAPGVVGGESPVVSDLRSDSPVCEASGSVPVGRGGSGLLARVAQAVRSAASRVAGAVATVAGSLARVAGSRAAQGGITLALAGALAGRADRQPGGASRSVQVAGVRSGSDRGGTA